MVWARACEIGCAIALCPDDVGPSGKSGPYLQLLVCAYGPHYPMTADLPIRRAGDVTHVPASTVAMALGCVAPLKSRIMAKLVLHQASMPWEMLEIYAVNDN